MSSRSSWVAATFVAGLAGTSAPLFVPVQPELFAAGGAFVNAWADYDLDGDLDLFVGFDGTPNRLYRNERGTFRDAASMAGLADARPTRAAAWGDADADGDADLLAGFTPGSGSVLRFYRNTKGVFADETAAVGLVVDAGAVRQPVWVDYDGDLDLDLFVAFRDRPNMLFRSDGGRFTDVARDVGLADARRTVGAVWFDYDGDGDLDLVTGNMDGDANGLFRQTNGRFDDVATEAGIAWGGREAGNAQNGTVRPCAADVDNDGRLDLFFANYGKNGLFLNRGRGRFDDVSAAWGIAIDARYDSCAFGDLDNDGWLDLYVNGTVTGGKNYDDYLFRGTGTAFANVTGPELGSPRGDHGVQWGDFDRDGALDLALTGVQKDGLHWLLRNTLGGAAAARSLALRVLDERGRSTLAGSTVTLRSAKSSPQPGRVLGTRVVDSGSGYNAQNDQPLHVGLPDAGRVAIDVTTWRAGKALTTVSEDIDPSQWRGRVLDVRIR